MAKLNVGDKVKVVNAMYTFGKYENGDVLTVCRIDKDPEFLFVEEHGTIMYVEEVELAEAAIEPGTKIRITDAYLSFGEYENGDVLTVTSHKQKRPGYHESVRVEEVSSLILRREFEVIEAESFKTGDKVKLIVSGEPYYGWGSVNNGDNGEVRRVDADRVVVKFPKQNFWSAKPEELELVVEEAQPVPEPVKIEEGDIVHVEGHTSYFGVIEDGLDEDGEYFIVDGDGEGEYVDDKNVILVAKATDRKDQ